MFPLSASFTAILFISSYCSCKAGFTIISHKEPPKKSRWPEIYLVKNQKIVRLCNLQSTGASRYEQIGLLGTTKISESNRRLLKYFYAQKVASSGHVIKYKFCDEEIIKLITDNDQIIHHFIVSHTPYINAVDLLGANLVITSDYIETYYIITT